MEKIIWIFPLVFIFHDMEEIIGIGIFLDKNKEWLEKKYPKWIAPYKSFSTAGLAVAVYEELIICLLLCLITYITRSEIMSYVWLGSFIGCDLHFVIHIIQSVAIRKYIPAVITSIVCLPISTWLIVLCFQTFPKITILTIVFLLFGIVLVGINLKYAQKLIGWFTQKFHY
ncbi:MAG: HXXEE domain-containing protein [Clostridiales bacterium]|nr:HXXEE domain-containing protein [Clostridiales bacterium]